MRIVTEVRHEETFTFTPDGEPPVTIRSGKLREWLLANAMHKVIEITFPEQTLDEIVQQHGLEQPRLDSMTLLEASEPVIVGLWPGGTHVLIDGPPPLVLGQAGRHKTEGLGGSHRNLDAIPL